MKSFKGQKPTEVGILNPSLNVFYASGPALTLIVKQPREGDSGKLRTAWRHISEDSMRNYRRKHAIPDLYDPKYRCSRPLYSGTVPGWMPTIMVAGGKIVGVGDLMFVRGSQVDRHYQIPPDDAVASGNLCVLDKYQGIGVGSWYGEVSSYAAAHFGANWIVGYASTSGGFIDSRLNQGFEEMGTIGGYAFIRKPLVKQSTI